MIIAGIFALQLDAQQKYATQSKKAIKYYEQAVTAFNQRNYPSVRKNLDQAIKKDSNFIDAYLLRAEMYRNLYMYKNQIYDLKKVIAINPAYFPYSYYNLASSQLIMGLYTESKANFEAFIKLGQGDPGNQETAKKYIGKCDFAIQLMNHPVSFNPVSLGDSINNSNDQYWPSLSIDGNTLYYSALLVDSTRKTMVGNYAHQEDFFESHKINGTWSKGKPMPPPVNTSGNEGALKVAPDGNTIVFTACNRSDGYGRCDIYFSFLTYEGWSNAFNARKPVNSPHSEKQPCLNADGTVLYFSSDRPGGMGGMDIWYSDLDDQGNWTEPKNMGPTINTKGDEESPFIHPDNKTFYFSSDGLPGLGQKDIFISRYNDSLGWSTPENLGYPINTYRDEIGLFVDNTGENAYYSTNFNDSSRNIYEFTMPVDKRPLPVAYVKGKIYDAETLKPLQAEIELLNTITGEKIMDVISSKDSGEYVVCLPLGKNYALNVWHQDYLFNSSHFALSELHTITDPFIQDIGLVKVKINQSIVLRNIFFESDSYSLSPESTAELMKVTQFIRNNPGWIFEIGGYTDQTGSEKYNQELSENRAKAVYNYLINQQISPKYLTYKGYGEVNSSTQSDDAEKAENRRTELKITGKAP